MQEICKTVQVLVYTWFVESAILNYNPSIAMSIIIYTAHNYVIYYYIFKQIKLQSILLK